MFIWLITLCLQRVFPLVISPKGSQKLDDYPSIKKLLNSMELVTSFHTVLHKVTTVRNLETFIRSFTSIKPSSCNR